MTLQIANHFLHLVVFMLFAYGSLAHALCVTGNNVNLRSGPGTKYEKTWEVQKYTPLQKVSQKGKWFRVKDVDGDTHWVYSPLVTSKYLCGTVKVGDANTRKGPGTRFRKHKKFTILRYTSFRLLSTKKGWARVRESTGDTYWVFRKLIWVQ